VLVSSFNLHLLQVSSVCLFGPVRNDPVGLRSSCQVLSQVCCYIQLPCILYIMFCEENIAERMWLSLWFYYIQWGY
jgi:hypothetical protein